MNSQNRRLINPCEVRHDRQSGAHAVRQGVLGGEDTHLGRQP
jgi:hypothetical protein